MTERQLKARAYLVFIILLSIYAVALILRYAAHNESGYTSIKDFSSIFVGIGGAYLAFCFQRRQAFLASLKDLWKEMILSKIAIIKYIDIEIPTIKDFDAAYEQISKTIDIVRSVYVNENESNKSIGFYSFQPLRDMFHTLGSMKPGENLPVDRQSQREAIEQSWEALRWCFLPEFARPSATTPIVAYHAADPRRPLRNSN